MQISRLIPGKSAMADRGDAPGAPRTLLGRRSRENTAASGNGSSSSPALSDGQLLAERYEITGRTNRGTGPVMYRASDLKLEREVAIQLLPGRGSDDDQTSFARARFERETRAVAGIRHPNVIAVHDRAQDADLGIDFLVLELLEGEDLATLIERHGMPKPSSSLRIISQAAAGISAGHRTGVTHRHLTPGSLFLELGEGEVRVRVLDFGVFDDSGAIAAYSDDAARAFRPPEILLTDSWLTPASDVYGLGAIAHRLLTGDSLTNSREPKRALREMETARDAFLGDRRFPLKLREVVARALSSHPEDRYPAAREFLVALDETHVSDLDRWMPPTAEVGDTTGQDRSAEQSARSNREAPGESVAASASRLHLHQLPEPVLLAGSGFLVVVLAFIGYLFTVSGAWDTVLAVTTVITAVAILPRPDSSHGRMVGLRFAVLGLGTLFLLGGMIIRAAQGSIPDMLFSQILISGLVSTVRSEWQARQRPHSTGATGASRQPFRSAGHSLL